MFAGSPIGTLGRRLLTHAVLLWIALCGLAMLVDIERAVFDADEGALIMQVQLLVEDGEWFGRYPAAELDPGGDYLPISHAHHRNAEIAPFPVRPALVGLTALAWAAGGLFGATLLGITGTVVAATATASIAARIDPRARILTFWITGLASPLAFHALVLRGHGLTTGLAALSLWCILRSTDAPPHRRWLLAFGAAATLMGAAMLRREAAILALAVAGTFALQAWRRRSIRPLLTGVGPILGAGAGIVADQIATSMIFDSRLRSTPPIRPGNPILDRVESLVALVRPGYDADAALGSVLMLVAFVLTVVVVVRYRRNADDQELAVGLTAAACILLVRLFLVEPAVVQGALPAFPLGIGLFVLAARRTTDNLVGTLTAIVVIFFALIALTQYPFGGGFEWASRYTAVGLPALLALAGVGAVWTADRIVATGAVKAVIVGATVTIALAPPAMSFAAQRSARINNATNIAAGYALAAERGTDLIISTDPEVPRSTTDQLDRETMWMGVAPESFAGLLPDLADDGYDDVVLFTRSPDRSMAAARAAGWSFEAIAVNDDNPGTITLGVLRPDGD